MKWIPLAGLAAAFVALLVYVFSRPVQPSLGEIDIKAATDAGTR